jgi:tRNA threonylcarbamoyladenosine biosynthesis protein TsaE
MKIELITNNKEETISLGKKISNYLIRGDVLLLKGDLGAGKTTFVKGVGLGLGIKDEINSPTFNILKCYFNKPLPLYHIDAYRLEDVSSENKNIGLEEVIDGDGVCVIEWPMFIEEFIDFNKTLDITIHSIDDNKRSISFETNNDDHFKKLYSFLETIK